MRSRQQHPDFEKHVRGRVAICVSSSEDARCLITPVVDVILGNRDAGGSVWREDAARGRSVRFV